MIYYINTTNKGKEMYMNTDLTIDQDDDHVAVKSSN